MLDNNMHRYLLIFLAGIALWRRSSNDKSIAWHGMPRTFECYKRLEKWKEVFEKKTIGPKGTSHNRTVLMCHKDALFAFLLNGI